MDAPQTVSRESPQSSSGDFNVLRFVFDQLLRRVNTFQPAKVLACTNGGGVVPVGYLDVQLLVNQVDGAGVAAPNAVVHNVPYYRLQGGANAIICDPEVGDIGFVAFAQRDISTFKNTKDQANPGSPREFSLSDAVWIGSWPADVTPTQFVRFHSGGIEIIDRNGNSIEMASGGVTVNSPADVVVNAGGNVDATAGGDVAVTAGGTATLTAPSGCTIDANTQINGTLQVSGGVKAPSYSGLTAGSGSMTIHSATIDTATVAGKVVDTHTHPGVQSGPSSTGPMQ